MTKKSQHLVSSDCAPLAALPTGLLTLENLAYFRELPPIGLKPPVELEHLRYSKKIASRPNATDVEILLVEPITKADKPRPMIIFIHGGGMVSGKADQVLYELPDFIEQFDFVIASIEYRLAPEAQFPAQQEDLLTAYDWLLSNASDLNIDINNIVLLGVSAGGGLAASFTQLLRDKELHQVAAQILVFPMLDYRTGSAQSLFNNPYAGEFVWTPKNNQFAWKALQGDYQVDDERKGWFSPALADNLSSLPSTYMVTGALDLFVDENLDYSRRLLQAGVTTELHVYSGAIHGFNMMKGSSLAMQYTEDLVRFFSRQFARDNTQDASS